MPVLTNTRHEIFAQGRARGLTATEAYNSAGYRSKGAAQNAARLKACPKIRTRVQELQATIADNVIAAEISDRNARVQAVNDRWNWLRAALHSLRTERATDMAGVPGAESGLLCRDVKNGKEVHRIDVGVIAVCAELRALECQAAQELGQRVERPNEKNDVDLVGILNAGRQRARESAIVEAEAREARRRERELEGQPPTQWPLATRMDGQGV